MIHALELIICLNFQKFFHSFDGLTLTQMPSRPNNWHQRTRQLSKLVEKSENVCSISMLYIRYRQNVSERFYKTRFSADQYKDPTYLDYLDHYVFLVFLSCYWTRGLTLLFYQTEPLKNRASLIFPSSITRNSSAPNANFWITVRDS